MKCPCGGDTVVTETRTVSDIFRRRRKCGLCGQAFFTTEVFLRWTDGKPVRQKSVSEKVVAPTKEDVAKANRKKVEARRKLEDKAVEKKIRVPSYYIEEDD